MKSIRKDTETKAPVPGYRLLRLTNRIFSTLTLTVILASFALQASAATVFNDNFSDGDAQDGMPVTWTEATSGDYDATSGDYVFTPTTTDEFMISAVVDEVLTERLDQNPSANFNGGRWCLCVSTCAGPSCGPEHW